MVELLAAVIVWSVVAWAVTKAAKEHRVNERLFARHGLKSAHLMLLIGTVGLALGLLTSALAVGRAAAGKPAATAVLGPSSGQLQDEDEPTKHWSFVTPSLPSVPEIAESARARARNPIDIFLEAKLEAYRLLPEGEARRDTLIRRLTFDLTGLPPTAAELDDFLGDTHPAAYERLVDRLLASPAHGERLAQLWLDLARYADSDGYEFDAIRPNAWRYRDWVVDAFNEDIPFDRFLALQLAGDEIEPGKVASTIATGFCRAYPDMVDMNDQAQRRQMALDDMTETTGLVFLGLTIGCARCHDHKYDPVPTADFYRLEAYFAPAAFRDDWPIASPLERARYDEAMVKWTADRARVLGERIELEEPIRARLAAGSPSGIDDATAESLKKPHEERSIADLERVIRAWERDRRITKHALDEALTSAERARRAEQLAALAQLERGKPTALPTARVVEERTRDAPETFVLKRGEWKNLGDRVEPGTPSVLVAEGGPIEPAGTGTGRRSALVQWLTRADHPLTGRVAVNRLWQWHMGKGLVATPSDFGLMGEEPTHPELLDWLARRFVDQGWNIKHFERMLITSAAYRRTSRNNTESLATDPENETLWRYPRRRLDGEQIRDALLAVSGRLDRRMGGHGVFPPLPDPLSKDTSLAPIWPETADKSQHVRRTLYLFVRRNLRYPLLETFDRPDTNASCPKREETLIAPQALALLNGKESNTAAGVLAEQIQAIAGPSPQEQVREIFRRLLSREPDNHELDHCLRLLQEPGASVQELCLGIINVSEFIYID